MPYHPVSQNTEEPCPCCGVPWMELRSGKVTGSSLGPVMANYGKAFGEPAKRFAVDIATIEMGGSYTPNGFSNSHTERGHEQEPIARQLYEETFFVEVSNGGFFDNGQTGASPDGLVYSEGLIEIKSVINPTHYACIARNCYDPTYKWQIVHNLKEAIKITPTVSWIDYISFCATFPEGKRLFVHRVHAETVKKEFQMIDQRLSEFRELVESIKYDIQKIA